MQDYKVIVNKSTVPVGTAHMAQARVAQVLAARGVNISFDIVSNPEFLKEGAAVNDFLKPDRIIVGLEGERARALMCELYEPFNRNHERTIFMDVRSAELTKYAANAMLATKISFMNEMANLAERLGADIEEVRKGIGADPRIGYHFIYPGCGYGGSCFPKDVKALVHTAQKVGYNAQLLQAVEAINEIQKATLFSKLAAHFGGEAQLDGKTIAVWGLAFKPNTDDMREAPSRILMEALWQSGATVQAYDPAAMEEAERIYGVHAGLTLCGDKYAALQDADALVVCTEWQQFRVPDFAEMATRMRDKVIIDGRNLYQPQKLHAEGWSYFSVGRIAPSSVTRQRMPESL
jgi:UDPglucose 6-dehydrogenase